jgi:hypothetical protein
MFKQKCSRCKGKVNKNFDFCPFCGASLQSINDKADYGILGKNDIIRDIPFEDFGGFSIGKLLNNAFKELPAIIKAVEKQMQSQMNELDNINKNKLNSSSPNMNIRFMVNGKEIFPQKKEEQKAPKKINPKINKEKLKKLSKLPKEEPASRIRRLSGRILYELSVPGVNDMNNILINQLENSIEIKAIADNKVYSKTLNINLPILGYRLSQGNLTIELQQ